MPFSRTCKSFLWDRQHSYVQGSLVDRSLAHGCQVAELPLVIDLWEVYFFIGVKPNNWLRCHPDLKWPQPAAAAFWFQARDWGRIVAVRELNPSHYTSGQWQAPGLLTLQERIPIKSESSETSKAFIRREKSTVHAYRHSGRLRVLCPHESLNHFYGAFLLGFLWPVIWTCLVLSPILVYSWSSHVWTCISQPRWIPARKPVTNLDITPLSTSKELSSWEGLLDFENEKYVVFYLLSGQASVFSQLSHYW